MDSFISQIPNLDASDIAGILRQVQSGSLLLEDQPVSTYPQDDGTAYNQESDAVPEVIDIAEAVADVDPEFQPSRHISLRRPGRNAPRQSDEEIPVPLTRNELQKQIFQARMMGAPRDVTERISRKTGLGSPSKEIRPNLGISRSVSHRGQREEGNFESGNFSSRIGEDYNNHPSHHGYHGQNEHDFPYHNNDELYDIAYQNTPRHDGFHPDGHRREDRRSRSPFSRSGNNERRQSGERRHSTEDRPSRSDRVQKKTERSRSWREERIPPHRSRERERFPFKSAGKKGRHKGPPIKGRKKSKREKSVSLHKTDQVEHRTSKNKDRTNNEKTGDGHKNSGSRKEGDHRFGDEKIRKDSSPNQAKSATKRRNEDEDERRKKRRKSEIEETLQAPPSQSDSENNAIEEIIPEEDPVIIIPEEPDPVVHSQVDKAPTESSFESLVPFKIPKKSTKTTKPTTSTGDKTSPSTSSKTDHKRGAAHESTGMTHQPWHGALPKLSATPGGKESSRTLSTMLDITGETSKAQQSVLDSNWYDNLRAVRFLLPEIPDVCKDLSRKDIGEIQTEFRTKNKLFLNSKFKALKHRVAKERENKRKNYVVKDWKVHQEKLFTKLEMDQIYNQANFQDKGSHCYLCMVSVANVEKYTDHINTKDHQDNIARAYSSIGKLFYLKYLQKLADKCKDAQTPQVSMDKENTRRLKKKNRFCEVCIKAFKGPFKKHEKTAEHKNSVAIGGVRPKCEVCDIFFNTVKDMRHHVTRQYHKKTVEQKIEYGGLPSDYKDPDLGEDTSDEEDAVETNPIETDSVETSQDITMETQETDNVQDTLGGNWFDNMAAVRKVLPEIPNVCMVLGKKEFDEIEKECKENQGYTVQEKGKPVLKSKFAEMKRRVEKGKDEYVVEADGARDWRRYQGELLKNLDLCDYFYEFVEKNTTCYLCLETISDPSQFSSHICSRKHLDNIARACSPIGRLFYLKYLQKLVDNDYSIESFSFLLKEESIDNDTSVSAQEENCIDTSMSVSAQEENYSKTMDITSNNKVKGDSVEPTKVHGDPVKPTKVHGDPVKPTKVHGDSVKPTKVYQQVQQPKLKRLYFGEDIKHELSRIPERIFKDVIRKHLKKHNMGKILIKKIKNSLLNNLFPERIKVIKERQTTSAPKWLSELRKVVPGVIDFLRNPYDWKELTSKYRLLLLDSPHLALYEYERLTFYFQENFLVKKLEAFDSEINHNTSINHQLALLRLVGIDDQTIEEIVPKNWFCYICLRRVKTGRLDDIPEQKYRAHVNHSSHIENVIRAGTEFGNMNLTKFLQSQEGRDIFLYCSECDGFSPVKDDTIKDHEMKNKKHQQYEEQKAELQDQDDAVRCDVCDQKFCDEDKRESHLTSMKHQLVVSCKKVCGALPSEPSDDEDEANPVPSKNDVNDNDMQDIAIRQDGIDHNIRGYFCVACNLFVNVQRDRFDILPATFQIKHAQKESHRLNVQKYYQKLVESKMTTTTPSKNKVKNTLDSCIESTDVNESTDSIAGSENIRTDSICAKDTAGPSNESTEDQQGQISWMDFKLKRDKCRVKNTETDVTESKGEMVTDRVDFDDDVKLKRCNIMIRKLSTEEINEYCQPDSDGATQKEGNYSKTKRKSSTIIRSSTDDDDDVVLADAKARTVQNKKIKSKPVISSEDDLFNDKNTSQKVKTSPAASSRDNSSKKTPTSQRKKPKAPLTPAIILSSDDSDDDEPVSSKVVDKQCSRTKAGTVNVSASSNDKAAGLNSDEKIETDSTCEENEGNSTSEMEDNSCIILS